MRSSSSMIWALLSCVLYCTSLQQQWQKMCCSCWLLFETHYSSEISLTHSSGSFTDENVMQRMSRHEPRFLLFGLRHRRKRVCWWSEYIITPLCHGAGIIVISILPKYSQNYVPKWCFLFITKFTVSDLKLFVSTLWVCVSAGCIHEP